MKTKTTTQELENISTTENEISTTEIVLNDQTKQRLQLLINEKRIIEQRINDTICTIADFNGANANSKIELSNDLTKITISCQNLKIEN
jgi:hypothetical protein